MFGLDELLLLLLDKLAFLVSIVLAEPADVFWVNIDETKLDLFPLLIEILNGKEYIVFSIKKLLNMLFFQLPF